ncbi:MAG TPA: hypothetical protein VLG36_00965 [Candidatus Chromulinivoraceae bacterium]|nr:hypothetical protein [Candidatus Chromulinivoraceae bacterium]
MKLANKVVVATIIVAILCGLGTYFYVQTPSDWKDTPVTFHAPLGMTSISAVLLLGATILFVMSLNSYKIRVRRAYTAIVISIIMTAIGTAQLPVVNGFSLWNAPWVVYGGLGIPFIFGGLAAYIGTRSLAKIVGTETLLTRAWAVISSVVVLMILSTLLPHVTLLAGTTEFAYDLSNAVLVWSGLLYLVAGLVMLRVKDRIGAHYIRTMAWLSLGFLISFLIITILLTDGLFTTATQDPVTDLSDMLIIIAGLLFMKAGYEFYRTTGY